MSSQPCVFQFGNVLVLILVIPYVCQLPGLLQVLGILFSYFSIRPFCYVFSVLIKPSRNVLFLLDTVVHLSLYFLYRFVSRIFFRYLESPIVSVLFDHALVSFEPSFFCQNFLLYFFQLHCQICLLLSFFGFVISLCLCVFFPCL